MGIWVAVPWRTAHERVGDEDIATLHPYLPQQLLQQSAGLPYERHPLLILVGAGGFTHEHQLGVGVAGAEDDIGTALMQRTRDADPRPLIGGLQLLSTLTG